MPKRKAPVKKKTVPEADSNGDTTDSAVAVTRADPVLPPAKKAKVRQDINNANTVRVIAEADSTPQSSGLISCSDRVVGNIMTFGQGDCGQLGLGDAMTERKKPFPVAGQLEGRKIVQVECGGMHTVALTDDGKVFTWGCNDEGALGRTVDDEFSPGQVNDLSSKIIQVSAGDSHTAALDDQGCVHCWGVFRDSNGAFGLTGADPSQRPEVVFNQSSNKAVKIASGANHVVILTAKQELYTFGSGEQGQLGRISEHFSVRGGRKGIKLLLTPMMVRFKKTRGNGEVKFCDIFCGSFNTFAVTSDHKGIYAFGLNNFGQLGVGDDINHFSPQSFKFIPQQNTLSDASQLKISGDQHHTLMCLGGRVYVMGRSEYGRLGLGEDATDKLLPTEVPDFGIVHTVSTGTSCSFAVTDEGKLYSWGMGDSLQLGNGEEKDAWSPELVTGKKLEGKKILSVSAGGQHTALLVTL